jgi:hypothetical protein
VESLVAIAFTMAVCIANKQTDRQTDKHSSLYIEMHMRRAIERRMLSNVLPI